MANIASAGITVLALAPGSIHSTTRTKKPGLLLDERTNERMDKILNLPVIWKAVP